MGALAGNNNGLVNHGGGCGGYNGEIAKYWSDLSVSGLVNPLSSSGYTDTSASGVNLNINTSTKLPRAAMGTNAFFLALGTSPGFNYYGITYPYTGAAGAQIDVLNAFKPADALAIDKKIDDGIIHTGNVIGTGGYYPFTVPACATATWDQPAAAGSFNYCGYTASLIGTSTDSCSIAVKIGSSTGMDSN